MTPAQRENVIAHLSAGWKNVTGEYVSGGKGITPKLDLVKLNANTWEDVCCKGFDPVPDDVLEAAFKLSLLAAPTVVPMHVDGIGSINSSGWIRVP